MRAIDPTFKLARPMDPIGAVRSPRAAALCHHPPSMLDRVLAAPATAGPIRLVAAYRSAASLLRELSAPSARGRRC